jgi:Replication initiator protein A
MSSPHTHSDTTLASRSKEKSRPGLSISIEKNLASLGFFTPSTKRIKGAKKKTILFTRENDGRKVQLQAIILPSAEYGLPITADQDKYLALQKIITDVHHREGTISNPIGFSSAELLRILGLRVRTGKNYDDIVDWGKRMTLTGICSEGVVYFAGKKGWATDTFHVFERFVSHGNEMPDGRCADRNYVWLSDWQLENINNNYLLPIDFDAYRRLKNHIAKALVPLLQIWLYASREGGCFEKRYDDLCQILNICRYTQPSKIKEKLEPSLSELTLHGYLSNWEIRETGDKLGYKITLYHGAKFLREQKDRTVQKPLQPTCSTPQESSHFQTDNDADRELLAEMRRRGISEKTARELLSNLAVGQHVMDQLEWGDYQIFSAPKGRFYNPSGIYIRLVRENITPPDIFESSRKRKLEEEAKASHRKEQAQKAALEIAYWEYKDRTIDRYIQKNYSKEFYASSVRSKLQELISQDRKLKEKYSEATLSNLAEKRFRQDITTRIPLMTFQEFCDEQRQRDDSGQQLFPGFVASQSTSRS